MKTLSLISIAALSLAGSATALHAQEAGTVIQTQANPEAQQTPSAGPPVPETAEDTVRPSMPADPTYQGGPYKGALTPPPPEAMNKDYPVCKGDVQDSCINPGAARRK
ncbi:hypothetical protein [Croceicoccus estronivorus]|uniref:hypothetical protein n=1 Tax=Croceicoccus estronivorus TaxID=1172626 RepID=UPI000A4B105A|nr:hypothetical protein [Croceicoccus estronivorus]